jgi:hypothetical protein
MLTLTKFKRISNFLKNKYQKLKLHQIIIVQSLITIHKETIIQEDLA